MELLLYFGILLLALAGISGVVLLFIWLRLRESKKLLLQKQNSIALNELAQETLFEMTSDIVIVFSDTGLITAVNPVALRLFPELETLIGSAVEQISQPVLRQILIDQNYSLVSIYDRIYRPISAPLFRDQTKRGELLRLLDVTGARDEKRFRVLQEQIQDIVFEWDLINGRLSYSPAYERQFGYAVTGLASEEQHRNHYVHPDDLDRLCKVQQDVCKGKPVAELEYRVRKVKNGVSEYAWVYVRAKAVLDLTGRTVSIIGTMVDIDENKKHAQTQGAWLKYDSLTGVLELESLRRQIECRRQSIPPGTKCQLLLIDVDQFRVLDQQYGHHCADLILKELAGRIHSFFSARDLIGRMIGDHFLVFRELLNEESEMNLDEWLQSLQQTLGNPILLTDQMISVSCCIGIAYYPLHGQTIDLLIDCADKAVYIAKKKGGNCISFYEPPAV